MKNSTVNKIKAKLAFHNVSDADAQQQFLAVLKGMTNNPAYPIPPVDMATYEKGADSFGTLLTDAQDGGKKAISAKDKQRVAVIKMYTQLGRYVESACNDDMATFITSGFTAAAKHTKAARVPLTEAAFNSIDRGPNSGDVVVKPVDQKGVLAFDVRYALQGAGGTFGPWTTVTITKPKKVT